MSLLNRITKFAKSSQGKKLMSQAEKIAKDPKTKQRIEDVRERVTHKKPDASPGSAADAAGGSTPPAPTPTPAPTPPPAEGPPPGASS